MTAHTPWVGWIEGPAADGVRRLRMKVRITSVDPPLVEILDVEDATDWKETR